MRPLSSGGGGGGGGGEAFDTKVPLSELPLMNPPSEQGEANMTALAYLHEPVLSSCCTAHLSL